MYKWFSILNLEARNSCLLTKCLFEFLNEGLWQEVLKKKCLKNKSLSQLVKQPEDSQFWVGLMHVIEDLFPREREIQT